MSQVLLVDNNPKSAAVIRKFLQDNFSDIIIVATRSGINPDSYAKDIFDLVIFSGILPDIRSDAILSSIEKNNPGLTVIHILPSDLEGGFSGIPNRRKFVIKNDDYFSSLSKAVSRSIVDNGNRHPNALSTAVPKGLISGVAGHESEYNEKHEINNQLMTILGSVQMLLAKPCDDPQKLNSRLMAIERAARMIARVNGDSDSLGK